MPNNVAAPTEADALRRLAGATTRVHFSAPLLTLILALLAALFRSKSALERLATAGLPLAQARTWRMPLRDWHFSPTGETIDDLAPVLHPRALRRLRKQRAWIGWILRGRPGRGMRLSDYRAPEPCSVFIARAPPKAAARTHSS